MKTTDQFQKEIISRGWNPRTIFADGKIHRFDIEKPKDKAGWYVFFGEAGAYGSWKGDKFKWGAKNGNKWDEAKQTEYEQHMAKVEKERAEAAEKANKRAQFIWERATEADQNHSYLLNKGIKAHGIRQYKGALVVPVMGLNKEIKSTQFVTGNGTKRFLRDGEIKGNLFWIGGDNTLCLCEGFATGASIHEATGYTAIIAFNSGNLEEVAKKIRAKYPGRPLVICGDNDQWTTKPDGAPWNPGREKALSLGWRLNTRVAIPQFPDVENRPTDFNDLHQFAGIEAVKKQIEGAKHPHDILLEECRQDVGAAFRPENLARLKNLKEKDPGGFETLRAKLKGLKVGVTRLDKAIDTTRKDGATGSRGGGSSDVNHLETAKDVVESYGEKNILYSQSFPWQYSGKGLWEKLDDRQLKSEIHKALEYARIHRGIVESILDLLKTETYRPNHQFDVDTTAINCLNGELHWAGEKWGLREHRRENFRTTQIPVEYDPEARAKRFERFLMEVFEKDSDQAVKAFLICEALGYSLLSSTEYEKFFLLIGAGANGKSVLMDTLASLVGYEHVAAVQPSQFENRFQRAHLHCKLVNLVTEIAEGHTIQDAELKSIVSGELTTAEHKHKPPFDFQPFSTCWFGSNHMPHTRDFSDALFRRAIIIPFNRTFAEHEQDKHLKTKLKEELPGILNLALEAMAGVFQRGEFTKTESCERAKQEWRLNCDQVQQFADDECIFTAGIETTSSSIFKAYEEWAKEAGIKRTVNRNNFTTRMCRLGAERCRRKGGTRFLAGVGLKYHVE